MKIIVVPIDRAKQFADAADNIGIKYQTSEYNEWWDGFYARLEDDDFSALMESYPYLDIYELTEEPSNLDSIKWL